MQENQLECVLVQNPRFKWSAKRFPDTEISTSHHQRSPTPLTSRTRHASNTNTSQITAYTNQLSILIRIYKVQTSIIAVVDVGTIYGEVFAKIQIV